MSINTRFFVLSILSIILTLLPLHSAIAATATSTSISGNVVWSKAAGPYLVNSVYVLRGATLTIEPGTVVMATLDGTPFTIEGTLNIGALGGERVTVTSILDDGGTTPPARGNWRDIVVYTGGSLNVVNADIRYGGTTIPDGTGGIDRLPLIENKGGAVLLDHSTLSESGNDGIRMIAGTATVTNSGFANLGSAGISGSRAVFNIATSTFENLAYGIFVSTGATLEMGNNSFTNILSRKAVTLDGSFMHLLDHGKNSGQGGIYLSFATQEDTTLPADGLPYVPISLEVLPNTTLTLTPGAVIKMSPESYFAVSGTLILAKLASSAQTIITSLKDDSILGDTNGDGSTTPHAGDWQAIRFESGSKGTLSNTLIHYGGGTLYDSTVAGMTAFPMIKNSGGNLMFDSVTMTDIGNYGISQFSGSTTIVNSEVAGATHSGISLYGGLLAIHNSSIHGNQQYGISNSTGALINATNNWWGSAGGPTHASNPFGSGDRVSDNVDYGQWLTEDPQGTCVVNCFSNVLFLPGLEASRLYRPTRTDERGTEKQLWEPTSDSNVEDLFLDINGKQPNQFISTSQIYTKDVVDEAYVANVGPNIYKSFLEQLSKMKNVDHSIADYAAVPYDWRLSLQDILAGGTKTGDHISYISTSPDPYILSELRRLTASSRNGKVTIMAHSNGGLVAKLLLKQLEDNHDPLLAHIDKLILIASPQVGTPEALGALLFGFNEGIPANAPVLLSESTSRLFAENSQGANNLLPSAKYFTLVHDSAHPLISFDNSNELSSYRSLYGQVVGNNIELQGFLMGNEGRLKPASWDLSQPNILNSTLVHNASETHIAIDDWTPTSTIKVVEIAGWGNDTLAGLKFWMEPNFNSFGTHFRYTPDVIEDGDGTVVAPSALAMNSAPNVSRYWVDLRKYNNDHPFSTGFGILNSIDHKNILEITNFLDFLQDTICDKSTSSLSSYTYISTSSPKSNDAPHRLHYFLHSPLSLDLYDGAGNHTGISTTTGKIESLIPETYYRQFGEVKYISAPASTSLHLVMNGQATGIFTLKIDEVAGDTVTASTTFLSIPSSTSSLVTINTPANGGIASSSPLHVDENGDGVIDFSLAPKLGGIVTLPPRDTTPPTTMATTTGTLSKNGWYTSNVLITLTATDTESGVASITYSLNSGVTWNMYTAPLTISEEGSTTIRYASTDKAGNKEATSSLTVKIDKTAPEGSIAVSTSTQDIAVFGVDNLGTTTTTKMSATSTVVTDQAGHTTRLFFAKTYSGKLLTTAKLTAIQYDNQSKIILPTSSFLYLWDIKTPVVPISQTIVVNDTYVIQALYDKAKNKTTVLVLKKNLPIQTVVFTGLEIVRMTTNKGAVGYNL